MGCLGDARLFEVHDNSHPAGQVGLYCWENTGARFERVEVRRPPLEAYALFRDRFHSGSKSGWSTVDEGTQAAPSNWEILEGALRQTTEIYAPPIDRDTLSKKGTQVTAGDPAWSDIIASVRVRSLDDDAIGLLFRYSDADHYYRFSMDSQRGYRRLVKNVGGNFSRLWEDDLPYQVGSTYELAIIMTGNVLRGYLDGIPMFVVEDDDLTAGQIGLYCWGNHDARFSDVRVYPLDLASNDWLLDEAFDVLVTNRWKFYDEGDQQGPSHWEVVDGELRQTSNIYGGDTDGGVPDKRGTYAVVGDTKWTDYRFSVQLRSHDDDAIGVMFRYQDTNNYYRFSMDAERSYRRVVKKVKGVISVLWEDKVQYVPSQAYIITMDCVGDRLIGYLDGIKLFTVEDEELAGGQIGLYCWANTGACFTEVRVAAPTWTPYYAFEQEEKLPAGARVRVYAGNRVDAPAEEPGIIRRFVTSLDERGQLRLPPEGVDLRLRSRDAVTGHSRRFLPNSDYTSVNAARVLRKADGRGFFVLVPAASPIGCTLEFGQYQLKLTYRLDNQDVEPGSQVLSQAGTRVPEHATLGVNWNTR